MISLGELFLASGEQQVFDADTGAQITITDLQDDLKEREVLAIRAVRINGELGIKALVGRRKAAR